VDEWHTSEDEIVPVVAVLFRADDKPHTIEVEWLGPGGVRKAFPRRLVVEPVMPFAFFGLRLKLPTPAGGVRVIRIRSL
jgi:hypothetical protein